MMGKGRKDEGMFLGNQFSSHMSIKSFLAKSTMVISVGFFFFLLVCFIFFGLVFFFKFYFIVLDYWKNNVDVIGPGASQTYFSWFMGGMGEEVFQYSIVKWIRSKLFLSASSDMTCLLAHC